MRHVYMVVGNAEEVMGQGGNGRRSEAMSRFCDVVGRTQEQSAIRNRRGNPRPRLTDSFLRTGLAAERERRQPETPARDASQERAGPEAPHSRRLSHLSNGISSFTVRPGLPGEALCCVVCCRVQKQPRECMHNQDQTRPDHTPRRPSVPHAAVSHSGEDSENCQSSLGGGSDNDATCMYRSARSSTSNGLPGTHHNHETKNCQAFSSRSPYPKQNAPSPHSLAGTQALAASKGPRQQLGPAPRCRYCLGRS